MKKFFGWSDWFHGKDRSAKSGKLGKTKDLKRRSLRLEELEVRTLLAVTAGMEASEALSFSAASTALTTDTYQDAVNLASLREAVGDTSANDTQNNAVDTEVYELQEESQQLNTPENLNGTATGPTSATITWSGVENADHYVLRYSLDQTAWTEITVESTETSYNLTSMERGSLYYLTIQATSDGSYTNSEISAPVTIMVGKLATPQNLQGTPIASTSAAIVWSSVVNADHYVLQYSIDQVDWTSVTVDSDQTSYTVTGMKKNTPYYFTIQATSNGEYLNSEVSDSITISIDPLAVPQNLKAKVSDEFAITATWDAVANAGGYQLKYWTVNNPSAVKNVKTTDTSYVLNGLDNSQTYCFTVKALSNGIYDDSQESDVVKTRWVAYTVVTTEVDEFDLDNDLISLREAIYYAGQSVFGKTLSSTVTFDANLVDGKTCVLAQGTLQINKSLVIDASNLTNGFTVSGDNRTRVFTITDESADVTMKNLTIQKGKAEDLLGALYGSNGGGIYSAGKSLTLVDCVVENNLAITSGLYAQACGGGIYAENALILQNTKVCNNEANASVYSGQSANALAYGGGVYALGNTTISWSTIQDNKAFTANGSVYAAYRAESIGGGVYAENLNITHSFVTNNQAQAVSDNNYAIAKGGGLYTAGYVVNSIVNLNTAFADSGAQYTAKESEAYALAFGGGIAQGNGALTINNATIAKNSAWATYSLDGEHYAYGGGVCALSSTYNVYINNSIAIVNNTEDLTDEHDDLCFYHKSGSATSTIVGHNNLSTYPDAQWGEGSNGNIQISYDDYDSIQELLDTIFVDVYDPSESSTSDLKHENYRLSDSAVICIDKGDNAYVVEADGSKIYEDLDKSFRIVNIVDLGAYENGTVPVSSLVVTTEKDVVDAYDNLTSLREAVILANSLGGDVTIAFANSMKGKTITLDADRGSIQINYSVIIDASNTLDASGNSTITVDAAAINDRIFVIGAKAENVTINGLTFANGQASEDGGAILSLAQTNLTLKNAAFTKNTAGGAGGAIAQNGAGSLVLENTAFTQNTANKNGGAVAMNGANLTVTDSSFVQNKAQNGGALYDAGTGSVSLDNVTMTENVAVASGGAVYVKGVNTIVADSEFIGNRAEGGNGGALLTTQGKLTITDSDFTQNVAANIGGAVSTDAETLTITGADFAQNTAKNGGALAFAGTKAVLKSTLVRKNSASAFAGGLFVQSGTLYAINTQITENTAVKGGGLTVQKDAVFTARNVTLAKNDANQGAGLFAASGATANLYNTIAAMNGTASVDALGKLSYPDIYNAGGTVNAGAVLSSFTDWSNPSTQKGILYDSDIALFADVTADGIYRLSSVAGQALDKGVNSDAVDENGKKLSYDILGNNRIYQATSQTPATVDLGSYEYSKKVRFKFQYVYGVEEGNIDGSYTEQEEPVAYTLLAGESFTLPIWQDALNYVDSNGITTLSVRVHFDSNYLTFDSESVENYCIAKDLTGIVSWTLYQDVEDFDGDPLTDNYLLFTWNNEGGLWKGETNPTHILDLAFTMADDLALTQDYSTTIRFSALDWTANYEFIKNTVVINVNKPNFDIDGDGAMNLSSDVNLLLRYMAGKRGTALVKNITAGPRTADEIEAYLKNYGEIFDIDGDGKFSASVDGVLLARYLSDFTGDKLTDGIVFSIKATRKDAASIQTYIESWLPAGTKPAATGENYHTVQGTFNGGISTIVSGEDLTLNLAHILDASDASLYGTTLSIVVTYDPTYLDFQKIDYYPQGIVGPSDPILTQDGSFQITWNIESGWAFSGADIENLLTLAFTVKDLGGAPYGELFTTNIRVDVLDLTTGFKFKLTDAKGKEVDSLSLSIIPSHFTDGTWAFDLDGNGVVDIATDGNILIRYKIFGDMMKIDDLLVPESTRSREEIIDYLNKSMIVFDLDGDGSVKLDTDINYFLKYLSDYRGDEIVKAEDAAPGAIRKSGEEVANYIKRFIPESQRKDPTPTAPETPEASEAFLMSMAYAADQEDVTILSAVPELTLPAVESVSLFNDSADSDFFLSSSKKSAKTVQKAVLPAAAFSDEGIWKDEMTLADEDSEADFVNDETLGLYVPNTPASGQNIANPFGGEFEDLF